MPLLWRNVIVIFSFTSATLRIEGSSSDYDSILHTGRPVCNDRLLKELDKCWIRIPQTKPHEIPTDPEKVERICNLFNTGMECLNSWSKTCHSKDGQEKIKSSMVGALNVYGLLCTNAQYRAEFPLHTNCFQRVSTHLDDCNEKFINTLKRIDHAKDVLRLCCIRMRYKQCVTEVANILCSKNATKFLLTLTELLLKSTLQSYHPAQCLIVDHSNCSSTNSAQSINKCFQFFSTSRSSEKWKNIYCMLTMILDILLHIKFREISAQKHHQQPNRSVQEYVTGAKLCYNWNSSTYKYTSHKLASEVLL